MTPLWARCTLRGGGTAHQSACPLDLHHTSHRNVSSSPRPGSPTPSCPSRYVEGEGRGAFSIPRDTLPELEQ